MFTSFVAAIKLAGVGGAKFAAKTLPTTWVEVAILDDSRFRPFLIYLNKIKGSLLTRYIGRVHD